MKALQYSHFGGPEVLSINTIADLTPGPGQVLVAVQAAGVNPRDGKLRAGLGSSGPLGKPAGLGMEFAGVVTGLGAGVTTWRIGDPVFGLSATRDAIATHLIADANQVVRRPEWLSPEAAAALPIAIETAARGLRHLGVTQGGTLLIHAASGGVGWVATQLALSLGLKVMGTVSPSNIERYASLGATPIDYNLDGLEARIREAAPHIDYVLDAFGHGVLPLSVALTGDPSRVVTLADPTAASLGVHLSGGDEMSPIPVALAGVLERLRTGELQLPVEAVFPLAQAADAFRQLETGHRSGKIVISVPAE